MKKTYELTVILAADTAEKEAVSVVTEILKKTGGEVVKTDFWGKKDLAFPIKKQTKGVYIYFEISFEPAVMLDFEKRLRLSEDVLRYLLVVNSHQVNKKLVEDKKKPKLAKKA